MPGSAQRVNAASRFVGEPVERGDGDAIAFHTDAGEVTYNAFAASVAAVAASLRQDGLAPGDRVALVLPDTPACAATIWGSIAAGAIAVPISTQLHRETVAEILADCRPRALVTSSEHLERLAPALSHAGLGPEQVVLEPTVAARPSSAAAMLAPVAPDAAALLQYTSGSTGRPKGVIHSHRALLAAPEGFGARLGLTPRDRVLSLAKLSFAYGFGNSLLFPSVVGASAILHPGASDARTICGLIERFRPTIVFGLPTMYAGIVDLDKLDDRSERTTAMRSVRRWFSAGQHLPDALIAAWTARFGAPLLNCYGMTELVHVVISVDGGPDAWRPGTLGTAVPSYELRIVDHDGTPVPVGEVGELLVKGPTCSTAYWANPRATAQTMVSGWIRTGDRFRADEHGRLYWLGRADGVVKLHGHKVALVEVENHLAAHPRVRECAIVAATGSQGLDELVAFVAVTTDGTSGDALARALRAHLRPRVGTHATPRSIHFVDELPLASTGKVDRQDLRRRHEAAKAPAEVA